MRISSVHRRTNKRLGVLLSGMAVCVLAGIAGAQAVPGIATVAITPDKVEWLPAVNYSSLSLSVATPDGTVESFSYSASQIPSFSARNESGHTRPDGHYKFELRYSPVLDASTAQYLKSASDTSYRDEIAAELEREGYISSVDETLSGSFSLQGGQFVSPEVEENSSSRVQDGTTSTRDQIIADDLIVQLSLCVGSDCANGESFGFDTIRLKENNLRIKFEDTSVGSFPSNDWQLTANDSASGGLNRFSIDDVTGAKTPFTVEAGAPSNSLYVDSGGDVGFGTTNPAVTLHAVDGNTPALRLDQDGSQGFTAQTWDLAGNETNFFIRDVTNASALPFRIRPGAPTSAIDIAGSGSGGKVGMNTTSPDAQLHVKAATGNDGLHIVGASGKAAFRITDGNSLQDSVTVRPGSKANQLVVGFGGKVGINVFTPLQPLHVMNVAGDTDLLKVMNNGTVVVQALSQTSDRNAKENIHPVDPREVLGQVLDLPVTFWSFKENPTRHIGPMAQDFYAAFGLDEDDLHISPMDLSGVAISALQGLHGEFVEQEAEVEALKAQNAALEARLAALEAALAAQHQQ